MATSPDTRKEPTFFQKLFGRSKSSSSTSSSGSPTSPTAPNNSTGTSGGKSRDKRHQSSSDAPVQRQTSGGRSPTSPNKPKQSLGTAPAVKLQTQPSPKSPTKTAAAAAQNHPPPAAAAKKPPSQGSSKGGRDGGGRKSQKHRKRSKKSPGVVRIDVTKPLVYPATPEMILAYHKARPFLSQNEEWMLVELNEFECLVDSLDIIRTIAKHSKFFEVEPDELWEEFFEFVDEVPSYDEVINFDVWQEFRDNKYPC